MAGWRLEYTNDVDEKNQIVYERIFGVWKADIAAAYKNDFEEAASCLVGKPWVKLVDLTSWKLAVPEAIDIIGRHLQWCRRNNMVWSINIINNPVTYRQLMKMFDKGGTKGISKTFRTRAEAEAFLREQGFKVRSEANGGGGAAGVFRT